MTAEKAASKASSSESSASKKSSATTEIKAVTGLNFLSKVESEIIKLTNKERAANGLKELTYDENLRSAARIRSRELYKSGTFAHERPNGDKWVTVIEEDIPLEFKAAGENLCMTEYNDPDMNSAYSAAFWMEQWINSEGHYANIVRPEFTHIGVGVYCVEKNGMTYAYATTIFATF